MKLNYKKYLIFLTAAGLLASCQKELNVFPTTSEVDGNVIVDAKSAATVLNGVYYRFANGGVDNNSIPTVKWTSVNEILPSEMAGSLSNSSGNDGVYTLSITAQSPAAGFIWTYGYNLVNAANGFLKNVQGVSAIPAATKKQMIGEARFLRAFGNTELLLYYGQYADVSSKYGIIIRNEFVSASTVNLPRSSVADSYSAIITDLDSAIAALPALNSQICYANASAAKLLKARVLINRGQASDYAEVINLTNDLITNSPFTLQASQKGIFQTNGFSSSEVIMSVQPFSTETYKYRQNQYYGQYPASSYFVTLTQNDPRNQWVYRSDQKGTLYGNYYGAINELSKYYSGSVTAIAQTTLSESCYAFRLSEAYLLEAEAITLSNGSLPTAKTLLKTVLATAGITDFSAVDNATTASQLQALIVKEEMINFFAENGADWFALRRLPFATAQTLQPNLTSVNQLILPIPYTEITANNLVIQNPGYN